VSAGVFAIRGELDGDNSESFTDKEQFIGLLIGREEFLLPIAAVCEIVMLKPITLVPGGPAMIEGVFNIRGTIMPAINLRRMMGMPAGSGGAGSRIVVVRNRLVDSDQEETVGLLVDGIAFVASLLPSQIEHQSIATRAAGTDLIMSIGKIDHKVFGILDVNKIIHVAAGRDLGGELAA
jgi:purine-binding chemotaxis protein CheW